MALIQSDRCPYEKKSRPTGEVHARRDDHVKRKERVATWQPRKEASEETSEF